MYPIVKDRAIGQAIGVNTGLVVAGFSMYNPAAAADLQRVLFHCPVGMSFVIWKIMVTYAVNDGGVLLRFRKANSGTSPWSASDCVTHTCSGTAHVLQNVTLDGVSEALRVITTGQTFVLYSSSVPSTLAGLGVTAWLLPRPSHLAWASMTK